MTSEALRKAREYEKAKAEQIDPSLRPLYHLTPPAGWMNDPNGLSIYGGAFHLFFQYHPYAPHWDTMYWGHARSADLLHWEYLPAALAPDEDYDRDGCFSGGALELPDGRQLLMYTGVVREEGENGVPLFLQTQNIAVGDGIDYEKYGGNPVLGAGDLPQGASPYDFRDPKIWREGDVYFAAIGSRPADGSGQILLYRSEDAFHWQFAQVLAFNGGRYGKMWECPDFFHLDGRTVLLTSPQDMLPEGFEFHNGNGTLCLIGHLEEGTGRLVEERAQAIDYGIDFYAPQTVLLPDGGRVMIGWMQNWDACAIVNPETVWAGQMSMPREISIRDGRLYQAPLREIASLRTSSICYEQMIVSGDWSSAEISGRTVELDIELAPWDTKAVYRWFRLDFAQSGKYRTSLLYDPESGILQIDRKFCGSRRAIVHQRRCLVKSRDKTKLRLHVFLDRFSCEVFVNGGEYVLSTLLYTDLSAEGISFHTEGAVLMTVTKYALG